MSGEACINIWRCFPPMESHPGCGGGTTACSKRNGADYGVGAGLRRKSLGKHGRCGRAEAGARRFSHLQPNGEIGYALDPVHGGSPMALTLMKAHHSDDP